MNEELFQRAVEAAAIAEYDSSRGNRHGWQILAEWQRAPHRAAAEPVVRAVFGVIADHADERDAELIVAAAIAESEFEARCCRRQSIELRALAAELRETNK